MASTIAELSRVSGCSAATVSRALNNSGSVSLKARKAVLAAMRQTQYLQKKARKQARPGSSSRERRMVEVVLLRYSPSEELSVEADGLHVGPLSQREAISSLGGLGAAFQRNIVAGILSELDRCGYRAAVRSTSNLLDPELLHEINGEDREGVLLLGEYSPDFAQFLSQCIHPLVLVDLIHPGWAVTVTTDNMAGINCAFDHLYQLGHRTIGFIGKQDSVVGFAERFTAYRWKMAEAGLPLVPEWIFEGPNHIDTITAGVAPMLGRADRPTAFLCANDFYAMGALRAASTLGISVPRDLSIVGFDDAEYASLVTPRLTTVQVPMLEIGRQAVQQFLVQSQFGSTGRSRGAQVRLAPDLVVRESTGPVSS